MAWTCRRDGRQQKTHKDVENGDVWEEAIGKNKLAGCSGKRPKECGA